MLAYEDVRFTDELIAEIDALVARASDEAVLSHVRSHSELARGFQLKKANCPAFRKKIRQQILSMHELDAKTADFLYCSGIGQEFVTVLSHDALRRHRNEFAAIFGHAPFTLALLLDNRPDVRELGCSLLEDAGERTLDRESACAIAADNMKSFAGHFSGICGGSVDAAPATPDDRCERIEERDRQLKAEQKRVAELRAQLRVQKDDLCRQVAEKVGRIEKMAAERQTLRSTCAELREEIAGVRDELGRLTATFEADVAAAVKHRLEGITNGWLRECVELEQESGRRGEADDLLSRADEVLACQARADRHSGNRRELQQRLAAISAKLAEVRDARAGALHPLDALAEIEARLVTEERRLGLLLGSDETGHHSPLAQALAARINAASGNGDLHALEQLLDELTLLGLPEPDAAFLRSRLGERYDRLLAEHGDRPLVMLPLNAAMRFRLALGRGVSLYLVCDGHNIINCMDLFKGVRDRSHADVRRSLSDMIAGLLRPYRNCSATIVFDGQDHNREQYSDNVTVIYSGGGKNEKHRADRRIGELLNWRQYSGGTGPVYVVTADNDLGWEVRESGAEVIPLEQFGWVLGEGDRVTHENLSEIGAWAGGNESPRRKVW
jgi:predicted RNA-binding protein with PIN domain